MKAYINNIPFDVEGFTNGINRYQKDFSRYMQNVVILFTTSSENLGAVRNWYQNYKKIITDERFSVYYSNGLVMFGGLHFGHV